MFSKAFPNIWAEECQNVYFPSKLSKSKNSNLQSPSKGVFNEQSYDEFYLLFSSFSSESQSTTDLNIFEYLFIYYTFATKEFSANFLEIIYAIFNGVVTNYKPSIILPSFKVIVIFFFSIY